MSIIFTIAAFALVPETQQSTSPVIFQDDAETSVAALALARTLNSEAIIIGDATSDSKALELVPKLIEGNADLAALEDKHPGIILEFSQQLMPITNRSWRERLPELQRRQAALYEQYFKGGELRTLHTFYTSATGQKLIATMMAAIRPDTMLAEARSSAEFSFGSQSVLKDIKRATPTVMKAMGPEDQAELLKLTKSGLLVRMQQLAPRTQSIAIEWMSELAPWEGAAAENLLKTIIVKYEAKAK